jgi:hypothetical protein
MIFLNACTQLHKYIKYYLFMYICIIDESLYNQITEQDL